MSGSLRVTWQELSETGNRVTSGKNDITQQLAGLKAAIDNLGGNWQGSASTAYNQLYQQWNTSATSLFQSLEGIANMLKQAATAYEQTETQLQTGFSG
jgi:WXG100 family type VII secretion target